MEGLISRKGGVMPAVRKYPDELRERAVQLVADHRREDPIEAPVCPEGTSVGFQPFGCSRW